MDDIKRSQVILGLSIAVIVVIVLLLYMLAPASQDSSRTMSQESIRQVNWIEVNPPPGIEGPCWMFREGATVHYTGVWCK